MNGYGREMSKKGKKRIKAQKGDGRGPILSYPSVLRHITIIISI